jgi:hypothetical protein
MPEDSRPELKIEAIGLEGPPTAPLAIPPGCSISVEMMVQASGASASAPSAEPPVSLEVRAVAVETGSAPTLRPPDATADHD